jgi:hypothetical protein
MPILEESASASSIEWVVKMVQVFFWSDVILETTYHMKRFAAGSMPADGSSSRMICGFPRIAIATWSFRLLPPDSYYAGLLAYF